MRIISIILFMLNIAIYAQEVLTTGNSDESTIQKTDLDDLRYDFTDEEIEMYLEQYDRNRLIAKKKLLLQEKLEMYDYYIADYEEKLEQSRKLKGNLIKKFDDNLNINEDNFIKLKRTYESMKPQDAASLVLKHNNLIVSEIFDKLNQAKMATIIGEMIKMDKNLTTKFIEQYTGFNKQYTKELMKKEITQEVVQKPVEQALKVEKPSEPQPAKKAPEQIKSQEIQKPKEENKPVVTEPQKEMTKENNTDTNTNKNEVNGEKP